MGKVRPWCGQPSDQGRLKNKTEQNNRKFSNYYCSAFAHQRYTVLLPFKPYNTLNYYGAARGPCATEHARENYELIITKAYRRDDQKLSKSIKTASRVSPSF